MQQPAVQHKPHPQRTFTAVSNSRIVQFCRISADFNSLWTVVLRKAERKGEPGVAQFQVMKEFVKCKETHTSSR